jgi:hypothetical protein
MVEEPNDDDSNFSDEVRPEQGRLRDWIFLNGEEVRLFAALATGTCVILWSYLYVLGLQRTILGSGSLVIGGAAFLVWRLLGIELRRYKEQDWRPDRRRSWITERVEIRVAVVLWLFIA